jgi:hypothetical protein
MNEMLYQKYNDLKNKYNEMLTALNSENEEMRKKAKWYYDNYKEIKKEVFKGRKELRNKQNELQKTIHANSEFNKKVIDNIVRYRNEVNEMKEKLGMNDVNKGNDEDADMKMMCELLRKAVANGVNVFDGLDEDEKINMKRILGVQEEDNNDDDNENEIGSKIIALIENDVNELFSQKMITNVNIDQINTYQYNFTNDKGSKLITFKLENDKLYSEQGEGFDEWLIKNFAY